MSCESAIGLVGVLVKFLRISLLQRFRMLNLSCLGAGHLGNKLCSRQRGAHSWPLESEAVYTRICSQQKTLFHVGKSYGRRHREPKNRLVFCSRDEAQNVVQGDVVTSLTAWKIQNKSNVKLGLVITFCITPRHQVHSAFVRGHAERLQLKFSNNTHLRPSSNTTGKQRSLPPQTAFLLEGGRQQAY